MSKFGAKSIFCVTMLSWHFLCFFFCSRRDSFVVVAITVHVILVVYIILLYFNLTLGAWYIQMYSIKLECPKRAPDDKSEVC
jgi:hypothetical protein